MLPKVKLIGEIKVDIRTLFADLQQALDRTVSEPIDNVGADPDSQASLLVAFCEMLLPGQNYHKVLKNPGSLCRHLYFSFLALDLHNHATEIAQNTSLSCHAIPVKHGIYLHLVSGSLEAWRVAIINCCSSVVSFELTKLFNEFLIKFEGLGFRDLWMEYVRQPIDSNTVFLIEK